MNKEKEAFQHTKLKPAEIAMSEHHEASSFITTEAISLPIEVEGFQPTLERILEEDGSLQYHSHAELMAGLWTTRVSGIITLASALVMIWRAWNRREGLFHRLVLGK